jgi:hypothetical protein
MQPARDYIRTHLARSLSSATPEDRLAAAWTAAAGRAMAARGVVVGYDSATSTVRIRIADPAWLEPLAALRSKLIRDLSSLSALSVRDISFELDRKR